MSIIKERFNQQLEPARPLGTAPGVWQGIKAIIVMSWLNVLLVCIPVSWALNFALPHTDSNDTLIFIFSFLSIIPLAKLLAFATDELSLRVGQTLAGLLNATLVGIRSCCIAIHLLTVIIALIHCELQVVQSSLVGSILSNLLLVLGMCFFAGGVKFSEQGFGQSAVQLNSSLLTVSVIAVLLPAAFHEVAGSIIPDDKEGPDVLSFSRGAAVILLFIYASYLVFQLFSHKELYEDSADQFRSTNYPAGRNTIQKPKWLHVPARRRSPNASSEPLTPPADKQNYEMAGIASSPRPMHEDPTTAASPRASEAGSMSEHTGADTEAQKEGEEEEIETPLLSVPMTIGLLVVVTVLVAVTAEWLVDSIDGLTDGGKIGKEWVGLILLPIVGNAAEHVTAVTVSVKDKLTLSLGVAVGSSIQIALFVIPFTVILSWIMGKPLTMLFDPFESIVLFLSVLVVNYTVQDGKSNWLEGMILMCLYLIIAVTFWYYPGKSDRQQFYVVSDVYR
ncbi:Sodium/calcium exchanger protein-domain-containing protein [Fomitopsis serialis]|uniref:Sodium/calcium exchanger protein-domain-containing protein n=1 Tax=Fomitopsis serialis TaxID=139415 RepID=UPI002008224A|nr:Sodium/calcium exchanger protein-domain-containing protein [Neoantrodia serialis]KAH9928627.1 Sodium/calcium exchanger protein-domain-containing protein [Neoantrodia serialis]